jgi:hypothetical protein
MELAILIGDKAVEINFIHITAILSDGDNPTVPFRYESVSSSSVTKQFGYDAADAHICIDQKALKEGSQI